MIKWGLRFLKILWNIFYFLGLIIAPHIINYFLSKYLDPANKWAYGSVFISLILLFAFAYIWVDFLLQVIAVMFVALIFSIGKPFILKKYLISVLQKAYYWGNVWNKNVEEESKDLVLQLE